MKAKLTKPLAKYRHSDALGNVMEIIVRSDNTVVACNQHRYSIALSNAAYMMSGGYTEREALVRNAARKGLAELRRVTKLPFTQVT